MGDEGTDAKKSGEKQIQHTYALVKYSDMNEELRTEVMELCVTCCEKYANNNETAAKFVKDQLDKKFGPAFHVVIGEGFGFEVTHEVKNLLYMFFGGNLGVLVWKCA